MAADVYVLLRARLPEGADAQTMTGAVSGVLAQNGALGRHETMHGDVEVELVSAVAPADVPALLYFDGSRNPRDTPVKHAIDALAHVWCMGLGGKEGDLLDASSRCGEALHRINCALQEEVARAQVQG